jgi:transcriptional regulator with XRE-family HTH domain
VSGHRKWSEIREARGKRSPEERAAAQAEMDGELRDYRQTLGQLRRARSMTQRQVAERLGVSQGRVSQIESNADLYLSTLREYVRSFGGDLELRVVFADEEWTEVALGDLGAEGVPAGEDMTELLDVIIQHLPAKKEQYRASAA